MTRLFLFLLFVPGASATIWSQVAEIEALVESHQLAGLSVVTRCHGDISLEAHAGLRDIGRDLPVHAETTFRMASISKAVMALAVAKLVEAGTLEYGAPLSAYLDSPPGHPGHPDVPLTVAHLLTHTSGIRDGGGYGDYLSASYADIPAVPGLDAVLSPNGIHYTTDMWGTPAPGEWFQYANLNFGVLATVMEAATGMRFDLLMESLLFAPYGLDAGFRVQQLDDINDLAVLYREQGGNWVPQVDHYEGVMPDGPDWEGYIPGVSAVCFSPQGGLRISTRDLSVLVRLWSYGEANGADGTPLPFLNDESLSTLHATQWSHDPQASNGNNYYGLFNQWSLGLHLAASGNGADHVIPDVEVSPFIGHPGEAYGLVSDAYATPDGAWGFAMAISGKWDGYTAGSSSAFYQVEEDVFEWLRDDLLACQTASMAPVPPPPSIQIMSPRSGDTTLRAEGLPTGPWRYALHRLDGRQLTEGTAHAHHEASTVLDTPPLQFGWHLLHLLREDGSPQPLPFFVGQ